MILRIKQIQRKNINLKETVIHFQKVRTKIKKNFNENHKIRTNFFRKNDIIILHNIHLKNQHFEKLTFRKMDISLIEIFSNFLNFFSKKYLHYIKIK